MAKLGCSVLLQLIVLLEELLDSELSAEEELTSELDEELMDTELSELMIELEETLLDIALLLLDEDLLLDPPQAISAELSSTNIKNLIFIFISLYLFFESALNR